MIKTFDFPRGYGKTTKVIQMMVEDETLFCLVPFSSFKNLYPEDMRHRIISHYPDYSSNIAGKRVKKIVLDEGFAYKKEDIAKLYYELGYFQIEVVAYGTDESR